MVFRIGTIATLAVLVALPLTGQSLQLTGTPDWVDCGNDASLQIAGSITVEAWIKIDAYPTHPAEIVNKKRRNPWAGFTFHLQNGVISFGAWNALENLNQATASWNSIPLGQWTHVAGVMGPQDVFVMVNGQVAASSASTGGVMPSDTNPLRIGWDSEAPTHNPSSDFTGLIDEVRLWSVDLPPGQIQANMHQEIDGLPGIVSVWHFNGSPLDSTGINHGVLQGNTAFSPANFPIVTPFSLTMTQHLGPGSFLCAVTGTPGDNYFTAFSFDIANALSPGTGWWGGLHITFLSLGDQAVINSAPWRGVLDLGGQATFALPGGTLPSWWGTAFAVTHTFDPAWTTVTEVSGIASLNIQ